MKRNSIKIRITVWYTALMVLMAGTALAFVAAISNSIAIQTAQDTLSQTVHTNLHQLSLEDRNLKLTEEFHFVQNSVYTVVYSQSGALLAGQLPQPFSTVTESFQNGFIRPVDTAEGKYYILDLWVPSGWDDGVWIRGIMEYPEGNQTIHNLLIVAAVTMPAFILLAALGGYGIVRRAFRPLDTINATATAINEGSDLSARIGLLSGPKEFCQLADNFDHMLERLETAFEAEEQFTSDASHELRTPVSVILSACEYAEKYDETPEERLETIQTIHRQSKRMAALINQLLQMTRMAQGTELAHLEKTDLSLLTKNLCQDQGERNNQIMLAIEEGITAQADKTLFTRLVQNLLDNAFKHGQSPVQVTLRKEEGEIRLTIMDQGPGIPIEQQEKIWQRFYQVDSARGNDHGTGLGLSIVRQIAKIHGGWMTLESAPGQGSAFTFHLPT